MIGLFSTGEAFTLAAQLEHLGVTGGDLGEAPTLLASLEAALGLLEERLMELLSLG